MTSIVTPSPSPPQHGLCTNIRRPQRKSTLTQQQKNQKRQRATQDQLVILELEFNKNPTPTAAVRERIAEEINMTERSVQIWFQNRRAKIKTMAKKSIENGEDCDAIPECMRDYLAVQAIESGTGLFIGDQSRSFSFTNTNIMVQDAPSHGKIVIHHLSCRSLTIGSWRRVGQNAMDLIVFYSPEKACLTYYINNDSAGYKIEYPFAYVRDIELDCHDLPNNPNGQRQGQLVVTLTRPPNFFMDSSGSGGFYQCGDFTEDQQASQVLTHYLGGHPKILAGQLAKLVVLDSYANRHSQNRQPPPNLPLYEQPVLSMSAPVSPHIGRPASSNDISDWQSGMHDASLADYCFQQKHRRTRSRSVPSAADFSQTHMSQEMSAFAFADPGASSDNSLYAPAPMNTPALVNPSLSNPLRIDTSSRFLEYRQSSNALPLSAATTASPSDYASPNLLNSSLHPDAGYDTPYSLRFISPLNEATHIVGQSMSPISMGAADPIIASSSPTLAHASDGADLFAGSYDQASLAADDFCALYTKQSLSLEMPAPTPNLDGTECMHRMLQQYAMTHSLPPDSA